MVTSTTYRNTILLVDSDELFLCNTSVLLRTNGFEQVFSIADCSRVAAFMASTPVEVAVVNLEMLSGQGAGFVREICSSHPGTKVIVTSTYNDTGMALECMRMGACDYLVKPLANSSLLSRIRAVLAVPLPAEAASAPRRTPAGIDAGRNPAFQSIITRDKKMMAIFRYIEAIGATSQTVMVTGETGTGKELAARALHAISERPGEFVSVNVAGLDDLMFSDSLFGHNRGAFTGADRERKGLIEKAAGGTLFLDEIGDLNNNSQVKLLRLLQEGEYYPLGSDSIKVSNARIVVATNCDLEEKMNGGGFRNDLYYRLCSHHIHLPALRERSGDIPLLVQHFMAEAERTLGRELAPVSADMLDMLMRCDFPGNIRELRGVISNTATVATSGTMSFQGLKPRASSPPAVPAAVDYSHITRPFGRLPTLKEAEDFLISEALKSSGGNQRSAAALLGISRQALNKRLVRDPSYLVKP